MHLELLQGQKLQAVGKDRTPEVAPQGCRGRCCETQPHTSAQPQPHSCLSHSCPPAPAQSILPDVLSTQHRPALALSHQ